MKIDHDVAMKILPEAFAHDADRLARFQREAKTLVSLNSQDVVAGLSLRAGGVPMVTMWWATGSGEGHHVAIRMSASLFGGSSRPSLK